MVIHKNWYVRAKYQLFEGASSAPERGQSCNVLKKREISYLHFLLFLS